MTNEDRQKEIKEMVKKILQRNTRLRLLGVGVDTNKDIVADFGATMAYVSMTKHSNPMDAHVENLGGDCTEYLYFFIEGTTKLNNRRFVIPDYLREFSTEHPTLQHRTIQL